MIMTAAALSLLTVTVQGFRDHCLRAFFAACQFETASIIQSTRESEKRFRNDTVGRFCGKRSSERMLAFLNSTHDQVLATHQNGAPR